MKSTLVQEYINEFFKLFIECNIIEDEDLKWARLTVGLADDLGENIKVHRRLTFQNMSEKFKWQLKEMYPQVTSEVGRIAKKETEKLEHFRCNNNGHYARNVQNLVLWRWRMSMIMGTHWG